MKLFAKAAAAVALVFATLIPAQAASAHAELETSNPEANSVIGSAPAVVTLTFGEKLMVMEGQADANEVQVTNSASERVDKGDFQVTGEVLTVSLKPDLADDTYKVTYRVVSEDGHPIDGVYEFEVNGMARSGEATPMAVDDSAPTATLYDAKAKDEESSDNGAATGIAVAVGAVIVGAGMLFMFRRFKSQQK
ncbi:MAG: copper resistance protein CopC [Rhodoluna sp.]